MENWGLLTYRETALLVDESANDIQQEYYIATVVSHEVGGVLWGGGCLGRSLPPPLGLPQGGISRMVTPSCAHTVGAAPWVMRRRGGCTCGALLPALQIAHQWFGDLVTLGDWTSLWLNEGFATLFENIGAP